MDCESDAEHSSLGSLVHIRASEGFPKKPFQSDDTSLQIPFPLLSGEYVDHVGRTTEGLIAITNYRLFVQFKHHFYNIPIGLVEQIECREILFLYVFSKDAKTFRCTFASGELCVDWHKRLLLATSGPKKLEDLFAFAFYAWSTEEGLTEMQPTPTTTESSKSMFQEEVERMGFDLTSSWRISKANADYSLCPSYPAEILVPASIEDKVLLKMAKFRSSQRIPAVVWRHRGNGCVIARCSQPEMGWMAWRDSDDEKLIQDIGIACSFNGGTNSVKEDLISTVPCENPATDPKELQMVRSQAPLRTLIVDARSYAAAFTNRAKGGGYECQEYYPNCEIHFMSLANIHSIRKSFQSVRTACSGSAEQANWLSLLENTRWLQHISGLLKAALMAVNAVDLEERPVIVHCSDGWDRTSQIVALSELMLDPYYRTMHGFQVLVEKEWLEFGHKFGDRCGHGLLADDQNERCPVFLQWLDCVHQLLYQFPICFEFNNNFLVKLVQHTYSCLFGTFLCNSSQERKAQQLHKRTYSVWTFLNNNDSRFKNFLYVKNDSVLRPSCQVRDLHFWTSIYVQSTDPMKDVIAAMGDGAGVSLSLDAEDAAGSTSSSSSTKEAPEETANGGVGSNLVKTRSCTDLLSLTEHAVGRQRRLSDPRSLSEGLRGSIEVLTNGHSGAAAGGDECEEEFERSPACPRGVRAELSLKDQTVRMTNGVCSDEDEDSASETLANGKELSVNGVVPMSDDESNSAAFGRRRTKVIETSTDTLVGELASEPKQENHPESNCHLKSFCQEGNLLRQEGSVHVSTSTTDISDSRVGCCGGSNGAVINNNTLMFHQKLLQLSHYSALTTLPNNNCQIHLPPPTNNNNNNTCSVEHTTMLNGNYGNGHTMSTPAMIPLGSPCSKCVMCTNTNGGVQASSRHKRMMMMESAGIEALKQLNCSANISVGNGGMRSPGSNFVTPLHSRTPSSGFPATPNDERPIVDVCPARCNCSTSSTTSSTSSSNTAPTITTPSAALVERKLDLDGLTLNTDEVQQRLQDLISEHQAKVNHLRSLLNLAQLALCQQVCQKCNNHSRGGAEILDEVGSQPDSVGSYNSEHYSVGHDSTAASDFSWEAVDEQDTRPTLWEPDHVVNRCPSCDHEFCLTRRKHHCRSCGRIFCSDCSSQELPVPQEQLYDPVRVCSKCFMELRCRQVSMDPRIPKAIIAAAPGPSN